MAPLAHLIFLAAFIPQIICSKAAIQPAATVFAYDGPDYWGWTPRPTSAPRRQDLKKRAFGGTSLCGYVSNDINQPLNCPSNEYCGWNSNLHGVGCCTSSYTGTDGGVSLTGCLFHTACYDSTVALSQCGSSSCTDEWLAQCTNSASPYCFEITFTDYDYLSYGCTDIQNEVIQADHSVTSVSGSASNPTTYVAAPPSTATTTTTITTTTTTPPTTVQTTTTPVYVESSTTTTTTETSLSQAPSPTTTPYSQPYTSPTTTEATAATTQSTTQPTTEATTSPSTGASTLTPTTPTQPSSSTIDSGSQSSSTSTPVASTSSRSNVGAIAGGAVGGVCALALLGGGLWFFLRRRKQSPVTQEVSATYGNSSNDGFRSSQPYSPATQYSGPSSTVGSPPMQQAAYSPVNQGYQQGYGGPQQGYQGYQHPAPGVQELPHNDGGYGFQGYR